MLVSAPRGCSAVSCNGGRNVLRGCPTRDLCRLPQHHPRSQRLFGSSKGILQPGKGMKRCGSRRALPRLRPPTARRNKACLHLLSVSSSSTSKAARVVRTWSPWDQAASPVLVVGTVLSRNWIGGKHNVAAGAGQFVSMAGW